MFNTPKIGDIPRFNKNNLQTTLNETANGIPRSFLQPKITSTPLVRRESVFATPPKPHVLSPRRYSLSEIATPPRTNRQDVSKAPTIGPLLTSTRYNLNVSTYEDTKSPGLAGRIVQYNEESERNKEHQRPPTHQSKYGSPGLFPVVHLFKKELPHLEQKPRTVTIRIASPEYSRHHSQEYNRKLLEGIVKPNLPGTNRHVFASPSGEGNNSTRSVLEALKEISRKRIHANEEFEINEDSGKRIRTENFSDADSNKRLREDSPLLDNSSSPSKSKSKRICMYDEYAASCSSMNFSLKKSDQPASKRKSISISTLTENPKEPKHVKLINAETQTIPSESNKNTQLNEITTDETDIIEIDDDNQAANKESPVKVFDDAPLERIRKNRLAALMGSLAGKDAVLAPKPDNVTTFDSNGVDMADTFIPDVSKAVDKPLVSILSPPKKDSPNRSTKHVHFSIPETTSQPNFATSPITSLSITRSSASITSPISSTCEAKSSFGTNVYENKLQTMAQASSPVVLTSSSSEAMTTVPILTFGGGSNSSSSTSVVSKESSVSLSSPSVSKSDSAVPNIQFQFPTTTSMAVGGTTFSTTFPNATSASQIGFGSSMVGSPSTIASPPKMGGFKFDLNKPAATSSTLTSSANASTTAATGSNPTFSFVAPVQADANKNKLLFGNITSSPNSTTAQSTSVPAPGQFSFGVQSTTSAFSPASTTTTSVLSTSKGFGTATTSPLLGTPTSKVSMMPTFKFGPTNTENKQVASDFGAPKTGVNFGPTSIPSSVPTFGASSSAAPSAAATSAPSFAASKAPIFSFGAPTTTSNMGGFGVATTSAPIIFDAPVTTSTTSGFGVVSTGGFGVPNASLPSSNFGTTATSAPGGFGASSTTTSGGSFGTSSTTPMFGTNKPVYPFGADTTNVSFGVPFGTAPTSNPSPFGKSTTTPAFGQTTTPPSFGVPTTTVSFGSTNTFGGTTTTSSSVFGEPNNASAGFGKPTGTSNIFGGVANTQASGFGTTTSKPMFGGAMPFGSSAPASIAPGFGSSAPATTAPTFGSSAPATSAPAFGSSAPAATFNFSAKTTANTNFGGSFGTTTTASTGFGTSTTPAFGTSNSFGSGSSSFGTGSTFGGSATPAFGAVTTTSQSSGFGTANTTPTFGNPNTGFGSTSSNKGPVFGGATAPAFGASSAPSFGATSAPSFGATAPTTVAPNAVVLFGGPNNTSGFGTNTAASAFAKPQTGFSTSNSTFSGTSSGFGTNQQPTSGFGTSNPPSTQTSVFSFGAATASKPAGVFSFGAPSSGEPLKPTFNFTGGNPTPAFGNSAPASFGNTGPPSFGAPAVPQFNQSYPAQPTAAPGTFSIGSGPPTGRTRTQLRAKRRT